MDSRRIIWAIVDMWSFGGAGFSSVRSMSLGCEPVEEEPSIASAILGADRGKFIKRLSYKGTRRKREDAD